MLCVLSVSDDDVWAQLEEIPTWLERFLVGYGIVTERGVCSKMSFLEVDANLPPHPW